MLALHCFRTLHICAFSMCRRLKVSLFDSYRPELHYMRGPQMAREARAHRWVRELDRKENTNRAVLDYQGKELRPSGRSP
jgi:hypothetical protein